MKRIRKGDEVMVLAGKDRGKHGTVLRLVGPDRLVVQNVNVVKRHTRPNPQRNSPGGIIDKEASIHVSNVALYNPTSKKGERVGFKRLQDGSKVRYFKKSGEVADVK